MLQSMMLRIIVNPSSLVSFKILRNFNSASYFFFFFFQFEERRCRRALFQASRRGVSRFVSDKRVYRIRKTSSHRWKRLVQRETNTFDFPRKISNGFNLIPFLSLGGAILPSLRKDVHSFLSTSFLNLFSFSLFLLLFVKNSFSLSLFFWQLYQLHYATRLYTLK